MNQGGERAGSDLRQSSPAPPKETKISKDLFEKLLKGEEGLLNTFENTLDLIDEFEAAYLATITGE